MFTDHRVMDNHATSCQRNIHAILATKRDIEYSSEFSMSGDERASDNVQRNDKHDRSHHLDPDRWKRRAVANSNERRRMQSINAGFQSLKELIWPQEGGDKLSKAAILQHTVDHIRDLRKEKLRLLAYNTRLIQLVGPSVAASLGPVDSANALVDPSGDLDLVPAPAARVSSPPVKRRKQETESSDEGIGLTASDCGGADELGLDSQTRCMVETEVLRRQVVELQALVDQEREQRTRTEVHQQELKEQLYLALERCGSAGISTPVAEIPRKSEHMTTCFVSDLPQEQHTAPSVPPADIRPLHTIMYPVNTPSNVSMSRRNLDTIVEAIRHLEGDTNFDHEPSYHLPTVDVKCHTAVPSEDSTLVHHQPSMLTPLTFSLLPVDAQTCDFRVLDGQSLNAWSSGIYSTVLEALCPVTSTAYIRRILTTPGPEVVVNST